MVAGSTGRCAGTRRIGSVARHLQAAVPTDWANAEWLEAGRWQNLSPLLDTAGIERHFDHESFLRDGFAVLPAVMADPARWAAAVREVQSLNDAFCVSDWSDIDWPALRNADAAAGLPDWDAPPSLPPLELRAKAVGKSQTLPRCVPSHCAGWKVDRTDQDPGGLQRLRRHGLIPEYFPCGYHSYLMQALYHPQMLWLQSLLFGKGMQYKFDHAQILTREPGYIGGNWHSHFNGGPSDNAGPCSDAGEYGRQRNVIFLFAYPDGFGETDEGGLKVVAGSHLHRDVEHCRGGRTDKEFCSGWMRHKVHPATGAPLTITRLALTPGSLVAAFAHLAHGVDSRGAQHQPRSANIVCYRAQPEGDTTPRSRSGANIPPLLQARAERGELPLELAQLITGVETGY